MPGREAPKLLCGLAILLSLSAVDGLAGGLREFEDGWLMSAPTLRVHLDGRGGAKGTWLAAGRANLFGLPELPLSSLAAGRRGDAVWFSAQWQRLGTGVFCEDHWRLKLVKGRARRLGVCFGGDRLQIAGDGPRRQTALALTLHLPLRAGVTAEMWAHLRQLPSWHGERGQRRLLRVSGRHGLFLWTTVVERSGAGEPSVQAEIALRLASGACAGIRIEPATGTAVLLTGWTRRGLLLRSSHAVHPELGLTHRWSVAWLVSGGGA